MIEQGKEDDRECSATVTRHDLPGAEDERARQWDLVGHRGNVMEGGRSVGKVLGGIDRRCKVGSAHGSVKHGESFDGTNPCNACVRQRSECMDMIKTQRTRV